MLFVVAGSSCCQQPTHPVAVSGTAWGPSRNVLTAGVQLQHPVGGSQASSQPGRDKSSSATVNVQCQALLTQVPPETGKALGTDPSSRAAGSGGTSPILCEINLLRSLVVMFLQGGELSSQSLVAMVIVLCNTHLLAFL